MNTQPIFGLTPRLTVTGAVIGTSANTATDGTGANITQIFQAGTNGSFVNFVRLKAISTIAATVIRLWVCTDTGVFTPGTTNTALNTSMLYELGVLAFTASNTAPSPTYDVPVNIPIPANHKLLVTFGTSTGAATTGFNPVTSAMDY